MCILQFDLSNIMHAATKVHMILRRSIVLIWMLDSREISVVCDIMEQCLKLMILYTNNLPKLHTYAKLKLSRIHACIIL